ncbi:LSU ribosomal protein L4P [Rubritalea squalenifaciens DSM 18772]|uniref:Large ribosomal subunit protein uL4 n=2 Tax=Rubritalea TaxID=361050 RepID=A0A1M6RW43_9BACT|nr:50S ribosomal protein L4 [Rubritalea squalenifaciens]SHK36650.1 LSU ribosomal protein L4P [Rubritalea squalenifaciens DSM 18772]
MSGKLLSISDAKAANITVVEGDKGAQAVHDLITAYRANRRTGSANSKTRSEVSGTGKKMYRQKGTGNARHGDKGAPIFVGGGVVFGPKPRSYNKKVTKSVRKLALRKVLGEVIASERVLAVDSFEIADGKTKSFVSAIKGMTDAKKVLVIAGSFDEKTYLAGRNVQNVLLMTAAEVNVEQILHANAIVIVNDALETLAKRTA